MPSLHAFRHRAGTVVAFVAAFCLAACAAGGTPSRVDRERGAIDPTVGTAVTLVTVGGAVTETVFALGAGDRIVGIDTSSTYPASTSMLPTVGYQRTLSAEGVLSLDPGLILATADAGPPEALAQLESAGARVHIVPSDHSIEGAIAKIRAVADVLGASDRREDLVRTLESDAAEARAIVASATKRPRVLFILARSAGAPVASGSATAAAAMIAISGGENAVVGYDGYRPLTAESAVLATPDVILISSASLEAIGGEAGLLSIPGLSATSAGRSRRIVAMDDLYLLGFGPRTGAAARELARTLHDGGTRR